MDHDDYTDGARGDSPGILICKAALMGFGIFKRDVEHFGEVLTKMVRRGSLDATAGCRDVSLNSGSVITACKLLFLSLLSLHDWDGQEILIDFFIQVNNVMDLPFCLLVGGIRRMALLPQELTGAQERLRMLEFPPLSWKHIHDGKLTGSVNDFTTHHNTAPLVELDRQISV
jgi:hypothetical protein